MLQSQPNEVTILLHQVSRGDKNAFENLLPIVYRELKRLAGYHFKQERSNHTLQATALVHEAYLKLIQQNEMDWKNRAQFFSIASQMMRRILIDHARQKNADKRGRNESPIELIRALYTPDEIELSDLISIDDCMKKLQVENERLHRLVELKFFGGLSIEQIAEVMGNSVATVKRDWLLAKAWLYREMNHES